MKIFEPQINNIEWLEENKKHKKNPLILDSLGPINVVKCSDGAMICFERGGDYQQAFGAVPEMLKVINKVKEVVDLYNNCVSIRIVTVESASKKVKPLSVDLELHKLASLYQKLVEKHGKVNNV